MSSGKLNIVVHKKNNNNGDYSKDIKKSLGNKTLSDIKKEREKEKLLTDLKKTKQAQMNLTNGLKATPFSQLNDKLPLRYDLINENNDLCKLLLKDPSAMTAQETAYINSLNDKEFKRFTDFLKMKAREQQFSGNGYGSGQYKEKLLTIYRNTKKEVDRYGDLKKYLALNYSNQKKEDEDKLAKTKHNMSNGFKGFEEEDLGADQCGAPGEIVEDDFEETEKMQKKDEDGAWAREKNFQKLSREILKEMDTLKESLEAHKNYVRIKNIEVQNSVLSYDLDHKTDLLKSDLGRIKNITNEIQQKSEEDILYDNYKKNLHVHRVDVDDENELLKESIIKKLKVYCQNSTLTNIEFAKLLDPHVFEKDTLNLKIAEKTMKRLCVLPEKEAAFFFSIIGSYFEEEINIDSFLFILEGETPHIDYTEEYPDLIIFDKNSNINDYETLRQRVLSERKLEDFSLVIKQKSVILIQRVYRGHSFRISFKKEKLILQIAIRKIIRKMKKYTEKVVKRRTVASQVIQGFFRKYARFEHMKQDLKKSSEHWLKHDDPGRVFASTVIQRSWRLYKKSLLSRFFDSNKSKMDINLLKTKICLVCNQSRVTRLCKDCENNHYCENCFLKFHTRGTKRNHNFIKINKILDETKKEKKNELLDLNIDDTEKLKKYIAENGFKMYEHLKIWDFEKNNTIKYKHLKDALSVKFFKFNQQFKQLMLDFALKFKIEKDKFAGNLDNLNIDYEEMCIELL